MNISDGLSLVQGPSIITYMIVTLVSQLPHGLHQLSLQWVQASVNTNLHNEFLPQVQKQQKDSATISRLATFNNVIKKHKADQQKRRQNIQQKTAEKNIQTKWAYKKISTHETESFRILQMLKFQKGIKQLSLVLFTRIFKEQALFFRRTIRLTICETKKALELKKL